MTNRKKVLCPVEGKGGKTYWMKVGAAFVNRDGSTNVILDAYPTNGKLQIRDLDERDLKRDGDGRSDSSRGPSASSGDQRLPF